MDSYTPLEFVMVNDREGQEESCDLDGFAELSARGFRVKNPAAYDSAVQARQAAEEAARRAAVPELPDYNARRNMADALLIAQATYPDADGGPDAEGVDTSLSPGMETAPVTSQAHLAGATPVAGQSETYDRETFRAGLAKGTVAQLEEYARNNDYDLSGATNKEDKVNAIVAQRDEREGVDDSTLDEGDNDDEGE